MKFRLLILGLLLWAVCANASDKWGAFSDPFPIHDAASFGDYGVILATDGGLRFRNPREDIICHSEHGLETSRFHSVVSSERGVYAVSEYGLVATYVDGEKPWRVLNSSYVKNNVRSVPHGTVISENILTIIFEDRLAFFDVDQGRSVLTIDRIGSQLLSITPVRELLVRGDSLYARMDKAVYVRKMDWTNLSADKRLSDPNSWSLVPADVVVDGFDKPVKQVVVDSKVLTDSVLYNEDGSSKIKWQIETKEGTYLVGSEYVYLYKKDGKKIEDLTNTQGYTPGEVYEMRATPIGGVLAATVDGKLSHGSLNGWGESHYLYGTLGSDASAYSARMKTLSILPDEHIFFHIWGFVYLMFSQWGANLEYYYRATDGHCFENYLENYAISVGSTPAPDNSGFLTTTGSNNGYGVVYVTTDGEIHCANRVGENSVPGVMYSRFDENGNWLVYVTSKKGTALADEGGLDLIKFPAPKSNGGELSNGVLKSYRGINPAPVDMVYDSLTNRLWLVSLSSLAYLDEEQDSLLVPTSTNGLLGAEFTSIDVDVHGNLWVGTTNQGVFRLTPRKGSADTLLVQHFTTKDGLLDNNVSDVAIDPVLGVAWFSHEKGVSYYRRNDLKDARKNMTDSAQVEVRAYPIPFRPNIYGMFTIDGIAENSVVSIFNRGGALIKSFRNQEVIGGKVEWNGFDKSGKLVAPGVYYYVVKSGSKVKKGKFIIVH